MMNRITKVGARLAHIGRGLATQLSLHGIFGGLVAEQVGGPMEALPQVVT